MSTEVEYSYIRLRAMCLVVMKENRSDVVNIPRNHITIMNKGI